MNKTNNTNNTMNPLNISNIDDLLDQIIKFMEYINRDDVVAYKKKFTATEYEDYLMSKFPKFTGRYYFLFRKLISGEDISMLFKMLTTMKKIEKSPTKANKEEKEFLTLLDDTYDIPAELRKSIRDNMC